MPTTKDLSGKKFNRLLVIKKSKDRIRNMIAWDCVCDCGKKVVSISSSLNGGHIKSCGCLTIEINKNKKSRLTHGMTKTRPYRIWYGIKKRCNSPTPDGHRFYYDRGITYDPKWETFEGFWEDMKDGYRDDLTIDRINNDGNYCKENCRWSTVKKQANNRRSNHFVYYLGEKLTIADLCEKYNLKYGITFSRIKYGWSIEQIVKIKRYKKWGKFIKD